MNFMPTMDEGIAHQNQRQDYGEANINPDNVKEPVPDDESVPPELVKLKLRF